MPLALRDLQAAFAAHVVGADRCDLVAEVAGDTIPAAARLAVHRHHVFASLTDALAASYPTVQAVVGTDFFRRLAHAFIEESPPVQPVLSEYGADLATFLVDFQPSCHLAYLPDVARLDWALNVAFHTALGDRLSAADLAGIPGESLPSKSLVLAPGTCLIRSRYPLDQIWTASQPGATGDAVDLDGGGVDLLVLRRPDDAIFVTLGAGECSFMAALAADEPIERASGRALQADPAFDLSASFARLLVLQAFAAVQ